MQAVDTITGRLKRLLKKAYFHGSGRYCPVCKSNLDFFLPMKDTNRADAQCPVCWSLERHRLVWLFFVNETGLLKLPVKKMLHIAPEACFLRILERCRNVDYLAADLRSPLVEKMDIADIRYPDNAFDVIYCSHVLEHIADDRKAMRELARVLKPGGWAVLQVPVGGGLTFEDPDVTDPLERERLFGLADHVRVYGLDYKDRLEDAGFNVDVVDYYSRFDVQTLERYGLRYERDDIYLCGKKGARSLEMGRPGG